MKRELLAAFFAVGLWISPGAAEASWLSGLLGETGEAAAAAAQTPEMDPDMADPYMADPSASATMPSPEAVYEAGRPEKPEGVPGDWVEEPYMMYGEYYPGYPGQSCFYRPAEEMKGTLSVTALRNFGKHKAGFGRPVYYPGDALPEGWVPTKAEKMQDWNARPHSYMECRELSDAEREGHVHLNDAQYVRFAGDGQYEVINGAPDYSWLGLKPNDAAKAMARMDGLTEALLLMGDATVRMGNALGRDTTDVLAAVNLVRQQPTQAGLSNLTGSITNFKYSSEEFESAYNTSEEKRAELKEAMEYAEKAKHASNKILAEAGLQTTMNVLQSIMSIGTVLQGGGFSGVESAFGIGMGLREELMGASDMVKHIKKAYSAYTENARAVKTLLNPKEVKEDSDEVEELVKRAKDGNLGF